MVLLSEQISREFKEARNEALARAERIEPTEEEKRNGWTAETLTTYLAEREAAQTLAFDPDSLERKSGRRKREQNHNYNILRWRG